MSSPLAEVWLVARQREDGSTHVRLLTRRVDGEHTLGIGDFKRDEWEEVAEFCAKHKVRIVRENGKAL